MRADIKTDTPRHAERNVMQWQIQSETETLVVHACAHTAGLARSVLIRLFPIYLLVDAIQNYCWLNYNQTISNQKQLKRPIYDIMIYFYAVKYKDTV